MNVNVILFGPLTDITQANHISLSNVTDTDDMVKQLHKLYPGLAASPYIIAVNEELISGNTILFDNNTVALLPPYAGG